jgi:hypothetical protein
MRLTASKYQNGHKINQNILFQGLQKCTKIRIFGLKIHYLATLVRNTFISAKTVKHTMNVWMFEFLSPFFTLDQGCQIFLGPNIPKREKYTK